MPKRDLADLAKSFLIALSRPRGPDEAKKLTEAFHTITFGLKVHGFYCTFEPSSVDEKEVTWDIEDTTDPTTAANWHVRMHIPTVDQLKKARREVLRYFSPSEADSMDQHEAAKAKHAADDQKAYEDYLVARAKSIISESEADARASYRAAVKDAKSTVENAKGVEK